MHIPVLFAAPQLPQILSAPPGTLRPRAIISFKAVSTGMCMSILSGATPLTQESWGQSNLMTARSLLKIGEVGGPRCCKRNSYLSLQAAAEYFQVTKGVTLEMKPIVCHRSDANNQCIGKRCPFHPSHTIPQS